MRHGAAGSPVVVAVLVAGIFNVDRVDAHLHRRRFLFPARANVDELRLQPLARLARRAAKLEYREHARLEQRGYVLTDDLFETWSTARAGLLLIALLFVWRFLALQTDAGDACVR